MDKKEAKEEILKILDITEKLIPHSVSINENWEKFELDIWQHGEKVRQLLFQNKTLRSDSDILAKIANISLNRNARNGRQSFIMLLGHVNCKSYARQLIQQMDDNSVNGHIIDSIYKMKAVGFAKEIRPFINHKITWIRNIAKKYLIVYGS
jgi:hypothetical protein